MPQNFARVPKSDQTTRDKEHVTVQDILCVENTEIN